MRYLVTGATGFLGGRVAAQLVAAGHSVVAIARDPSTAAHLTTLGVELRSGDVTDKNSLREPMRGVDGVFHVAGWYKIGARDKTPAVRTNINGTRHVLELMDELHVPKGVYTSTLAVNSDTHGQVVDESYRFTGDHLTEYDRTKAEAHRLAEEFIRRGVPLVIAQPGLIYGPGDTSAIRVLWQQFLERRLPLVPEETAFAWGHVEDVARGHLLAMERGRVGTNYFICGPVHTMVEAVQLASELTGIPAPSRRASPRMLRTLAGVMGLIEKVVPLAPAYTSEGLRVIAGVTYIGSNARARRELGWVPRPLREGLGETLRHEMQALGLRPQA